MAKVSTKSRPSTSTPKTPQGQRQTSFEKTTIRSSDTAPDMPHEQNRGDAKARPGAREVRRRPGTGSRNVQQEKQGKALPAPAGVYESSRDDESAVGTTKSAGRGKLGRKPRTGKSAK